MYQPSFQYHLKKKNNTNKKNNNKKTDLLNESSTSLWLFQHQLACFCAAERFLWWAEVNKEMEMRSSTLIQPGCRSQSNPPKSCLAWGMQRGNPAPRDLIHQQACAHARTHSRTHTDTQLKRKIRDYGKQTE